LDNLEEVLRAPMAPWILTGAYLLGSIPFGLLLATFFAKKDRGAEGSSRVEHLEKQVQKNPGSFHLRIKLAEAYIQEGEREKGLDFDLEKTAFFLGRINLMTSEKPQMPRWQGRIFSFLSRNELDAASYFDIPSSQVIDLGVPLEL